MAHYRGKREARPVEDPFQEDQEKKNSPWRGLTIAAIVVAGLALVVTGVVIGVKSWMKPPELPVGPGTPDQSQTGEETPGAPGTPEGPSDDELYPDDGYSGEMPTLSGNRRDGAYTFLLVGTDKDDGNTDTIMVASYDTVNQNVNIMSIPRDTMINEKWDIKKINSVYSRTGSSIESLAKRVQKLVGFLPDFYVKVDLAMFVELVDLVGGVEFDVPRDMDYEDPYQNLFIHLKKGVQVLDGEHAMQLVRFRRYPEGDIKRVEVQQNFMKALIKECLNIKHWGKIKAYIDLAMKNVQTDLEMSSVVWFAANVLGLNEAPALDMANVYTCTLPANYYATAWSRDTKQEQSYVTIYPNQVVNLVNERFNPYEQKVTTGMLDAMSILSNGDIASSTGNLKDTQHNGIMAVRRGEAYYNEQGEIVMGRPPEKPEQDVFGNYFVVDENGNIIYTDENGQPTLPPDDSVDTNTGSDADNTIGDGTDDRTEETEPPVIPEIPTIPELPEIPEIPSGENENDTEETPAVDDDMPDWLQP